MKAITRTLLALFIVSAGFAWAADGGLEELLPVPAPAQSEQQGDVETQVEPESTITTEDLEAMQGDELEAGACCVAECYEEWAECVGGCSDQACRADCRADLIACKSGC